MTWSHDHGTKSQNFWYRLLKGLIHVHRGKLGCCTWKINFTAVKRVWDSQDGVSHIGSRMAETIGGTSLVLHWRKQDPGSSFPRSFLNYMTQPSTTQVMALPARSEQYGLFLTPNDWTIYLFDVQIRSIKYFQLSLSLGAGMAPFQFARYSRSSSSWSSCWTVLWCDVIFTKVGLMHYMQAPTLCYSK